MDGYSDPEVAEWAYVQTDPWVGFFKILEVTPVLLSPFPLIIYDR